MSQYRFLKVEEDSYPAGTECDVQSVSGSRTKYFRTRHVLAHVPLSDIADLRSVLADLDDQALDCANTR